MAALRRTSETMKLIVNLSNASKYHKEHCSDSCIVSLMDMKQAARFLYLHSPIKESEIDELLTIINDMPSY